MGNILVKSLQADQLIPDLEETFATLWKYRMKLKCVFGVTKGCFLRYMVTEWGIEANPAKIDVVHQMQPPKNLREVQRLLGRIIALSRFISRSADRSLPFFKILK